MRNFLLLQVLLLILLIGNETAFGLKDYKLPFSDSPLRNQLNKLQAKAAPKPKCLKDKIRNFFKCSDNVETDSKTTLASHRNGQKAELNAHGQETKAIVKEQIPSQEKPTEQTSMAKKRFQKAVDRVQDQNRYLHKHKQNKLRDLVKQAGEQHKMTLLRDRVQRLEDRREQEHQRREAEERLRREEERKPLKPTIFDKDDLIRAKMAAANFDGSITPDADRNKMEK